MSLGIIFLGTSSLGIIFSGHQYSSDNIIAESTSLMMQEFNGERCASLSLGFWQDANKLLN